MAAIAVAAVAGLAVGGCGSDSLGGGDEQADAPDRPVKVGMIVPLAGPFAGLGENMKRGFELYLDQHDGRLGGREVELVTLDEGATPQTGVSAARRLVEREQVDVGTGVMSSAVAQGAREVFDAARTPIVFSNGRPYGALTAEPSPYAWVVSYPYDLAEVISAQRMADQVGDGGAYFLATDFVAGHLVTETVKREFTAAGGKVTGQAFAPLGTTQDFQPYLSRAQASGADAIYAFFAGTDAVRFVRQFHDFTKGTGMRLYSAGALTEGEELLKAQGRAALGIETVSIYVDTLETPENKSFVEAYRAKHGGATPDTYAMFGWDSAQVIDEAIAKAGDEVNRETITKALEAGFGPLKGPRGTWELNTTYQTPNLPLYLRRVEERDGRIENVLVKPLGYFLSDGKKVEAP